MIPLGQQQLGAIQASLDTELVRSLSEEGLELANEMVRRDTDLVRDVLDGERLIAGEQIAGETKASKSFVIQQHGRILERLWPI
jgi:hypothetical protein